MRHAGAAFALLGVLGVSTAGLSAASAGGGDAPAGAPQTPAVLVSTDAVRGVVKSISRSSLVIVGSGNKAGEMTFLLGPSTNREGELKVGATVSVRYRREGETLIATGVSTQPEKLHTPRRVKRP